MSVTAGQPHTVHGQKACVGFTQHPESTAFGVEEAIAWLHPFARVFADYGALAFAVCLLADGLWRAGGRTPG
jgi:hypothetical protein